jgi:hypothetical protein
MTMKTFFKPSNLAKKAILFGLSLLILALVSGCASLKETNPVYFSEAQCLPDFPNKDGWYGGDGAYSIALDKQRTLWLFGDTFVSGEAGRKDRIGMDVVMGTTMAISTCGEKGQFQIQYFLKEKNGKFLSSFGKNEWLWPQDPFIVNQVLYIPLLVVKAMLDLKEPLNFKIVRHKIARIKNYTLADPRQWLVDYIDLKEAIPPGIEAFATTSVIFQNYVYFYPLYTSVKKTVKTSGNILVRIPVEKIDDPVNFMEYLNKSGKWEIGLAPARARIVLSAGVSELSVRYHADDNKWIAVYMSNINIGNQLLYQTADKPEGPWSKPMALIETIPEVDSKSPRYDKHNFCYAGKEHIEFARAENLVVTYVCNSAENFKKKNNFIRRNLFLYRPVVNNIRLIF